MAKGSAICAFGTVNPPPVIILKFLQAIEGKNILNYPALPYLIQMQCNCCNYVNVSRRNLKICVPPTCILLPTTKTQHENFNVVPTTEPQ